jgi:hypothetical protein
MAFELWVGKEGYGLQPYINSAKTGALNVEDVDTRKRVNAARLPNASRDSTSFHLSDTA